MAYVEDEIVTPDSGDCGDVFTIKVTASFDGTLGRTISVRIPASAGCVFGDGSSKVTRDASSSPCTITFRQKITCKRAGTTSFWLYAQASETGGDTHETYRTMSVTC